jgi:hypothetical protein
MAWISGFFGVSAVGTAQSGFSPRKSDRVGLSRIELIRGTWEGR